MGSDFLKLGAVKGFADGSLGSLTAWMSTPYDDDPGNCGLATALLNPPAEDGSAGATGGRRGDSALHPRDWRPGDLKVLNIYEQIGGDHPATHRFRVEHAQHVRPEDFARFHKLGIIVSMQPYHAIDDGRWGEKRIGHERARSSFAWRSMLDAGVALAFGSDWPMAPLDPLLGIYAAVTRATLDGESRRVVSGTALDGEEALRAYTQGCAFASFEEQEKGTISPGKFADLVVLSDDLFKIPPDRIKNTKVEITIVGGRVVYNAGSYRR